MQSPTTNTKNLQEAYVLDKHPTALTEEVYVLEGTVAEGVVVVQMSEPAKETKTGLFIPDSMRNKLRTDYGKVIATGSELSFLQNKMVLVHYSYGKVIEGFGWDEDSTLDCEIRLYGMNGGPGSTSPFTRYPYWYAVLATVEDEDTLKATGGNIIVEYDGVKETSMGLILTHEQFPFNNVTVLDAGPDCYDIKPGDRLLLDNTSHPVILRDRNQAIVRFDKVLGVIE